MPLPTCSVSLPVSERPFSAWPSRTTIRRRNVASDVMRDAHLRAFRFANRHANHDANYAANFHASSDASTGAIRLQTSIPNMVPLAIAQVHPTRVPTVSCEFEHRLLRVMHTFMLSGLRTIMRITMPTMSPTFTLRQMLQLVTFACKLPCQTWCRSQLRRFIQHECQQFRVSLNIGCYA
jgi:hypothetical protein